MSNGDDDTGRKSHVIRIYKDDDPNSDQWLDIERLDELKYKSGRKYQYRVKTWKFDWDDFDPHDPDVGKKRILDPNDESQETWVEVPVRDQITLHEATREQYQSKKYNFVNDNGNDTRETHSRLVYHHDIDDKYLDGNGQPPSDPEQYLNALGDQDEEQYVEVELLGKYWTTEHESIDWPGRSHPSAWQGRKWIPTENDRLLRDPILETDKADRKFVPVINPDAGPQVDPPWRLDPLQNIVNVSWGGGLAVEFYEQTEEEKLQDEAAAESP